MDPLSLAVLAKKAAVAEAFISGEVCKCASEGMPDIISILSRRVATDVRRVCFESLRACEGAADVARMVAVDDVDKFTAIGIEVLLDEATAKEGCCIVLADRFLSGLSGLLDVGRP